MNVEIFERCSIEKIDTEMGSIVDTTRDSIQNMILNAVESIVIARIELAVRSKTATSRQNDATVTASSERGGKAKTTALFENVSKKD